MTSYARHRKQTFIRSCSGSAAGASVSGRGERTWRNLSGFIQLGDRGAQCGEANSEAPSGWEEPDSSLTISSAVCSASFSCRRPFLYAFWITVAATSSCFLLKVLLVGSCDTCGSNNHLSGLTSHLEEMRKCKKSCTTENDPEKKM